MKPAVVPDKICPGCGARLRAGALDGLCPRCLLGALMNGSEPPVAAPGAEKFGDYELLGVIARGGSGIVHRARHAELDRIVALKLLSHDAGGGSEFLERFRIEAAAAASLEHPHIVPVYDFGARDGRHFLAMKLIEGTAATERMAPRAAAQRLVTIARAVHHAHQRGVLHRDLKPANILLDGSGEPHLTDFGLAKLTSSDSTITRTRSVLGTPAYMAPEQAAGKAREITTAADVYGLGAVLYHWITGGPPFAGGTTVETIRMVVDAEPEPPSRRVRGVDRDLETVCLKCLRKEPSQRYASADALAADLERWLRGEPVLARPVGAVERLAKWVRRNRALAFVIAASLATLVAAAGVLAWQNLQLERARGRAGALAEKQRHDLVRLHVATGNRLAEEGDGYAALASFSEAAALDAGDPDKLAMHHYRFAATLAHLPALKHTFQHDNTVNSATFSSDGSRVVTASADRTACVWDVKTGEALTPPLPHGAPVWWAGFAADNTRILTRTKKGDVHLWDAATGAPAGGPFPGRPDMPSPVDGLSKSVPVSPDGRIFAVLRERSVERRRVEDGSPAGDSLPCPEQPGCVLFSPDGSGLAVFCENGAGLIFSSATGAVLHSIPPEAINGPGGPIGWRSGAWSPDGSKLALTDRAFGARVLPADLSRVSAPLAHKYLVLGAVWAKNSGQILTWSFDNTVRLWDAAALRPALPPVRHHGPVLDAAFSPDEHWIASACRDGTARLWNPVTGDNRGPIVRHRNSVMDVEWSPEGSLLLTASGDKTARLWNIAGSARPHRESIHTSAVESLTLSPDARLVATRVLDNSAYIWDDTGARVAILTHPTRPFDLAWVNSSHLLTITADATLREWDVVESKVVRTLKAAPPDDAKQGMRLSPDARWLAVRPRSSPARIYSTADGALLVTVASPPAAVLVWSPCSRLLATVHPEAGAASISLTDIATGRTAPPVTLQNSSGAPALDHGCRRIAYADSGYGVRTLDLATGATTGPMPHDAALGGMTFTSDGRILATGSQDGNLRLWDAATGEPLTPPLPHAGWIRALQAHPDGHRFFTAGNNGVLSEWRVPARPWTPDEMQRVARGEEPATP